MCRGGTEFEVTAKAKELGLTWQGGGVKRNPDTKSTEANDDNGQSA